jgi:hypothetical protein
VYDERGVGCYGSTKEGLVLNVLNSRTDWDLERKVVSYTVLQISMGQLSSLEDCNFVNGVGRCAY